MNNLFWFIVLAVSVIGGLCLALYVGVWLMLICGIVQVITAIQEVPVDAYGIGIGAARAILFMPAMGLTYMLCYSLGIFAFNKMD